jgi:hypothetical protein
VWQDVVTAALVGTERQSLTFTPPNNKLGELLRRLDSTDAEGSLLSAAGAIALYQKAGQLPVKDSQPLPKECELDDQPCCSSRAGHHLDLMLNGEYKELLPEWLAATAKVGKRVPDLNLPDLLELGRKQSELREAILPVLGKRGYWLASQNLDWNYVVGDVKETWQTGSRAARKLILKNLRAENPSAARERLATTWASEGAKEKVAFLETFQTGLSVEDEPFLEAALDERSKEVRRVAAQLLARLPKSRLCLRMIERSRSLLIFKQEGELYLEVILPESCDKAMSRDAIESKVIHNLGEKAGWLLQMLANVPPSFWCSTWKTNPAQLIQVVDRSDWQSLLIKGWAIAALRHQDSDWAEAILPTVSKLALVSRLYSYLLLTDEQLIAGLIEVLPRDHREAFIRHLLPSNSVGLSSKDQGGFHLLCYYREPWSAEFSHAVLEGVYLYTENSNGVPYWPLLLALKEFACYITPSLTHKAAALSTVAKEGTPWMNAINEFLAILQFRYEMLQALGSKS